MDPVEVIKTTPLATQKSVRPNTIRGLTSAKAGKIIPLAYMPLLREDRVSRGRMSIRFEMAETPRPLMNAVNVTAHAYFVPFLALPHFEGSLDQLNRSYKKQPQIDGGATVNFFPTIAYDSAAPFWKTLGIHADAGATINAAPLHAYNALVNWRYRARSKSLTERLMTDTSLATCFWKNGSFTDVVPDFDQAKIDGEIDLQIAAQSAHVKGIGFISGDTWDQTNRTVRESGGTGTELYAKADQNSVIFKQDPLNTAYPLITAELAAQGVKLSLANIDLAKKTAAFAEVRKQMNGIEDDHIIDMLMDGIRVPDEMMKQPILLDRKSTVFGFSERYASDGANLDQSVTRGETFLDLRFRTPPMNTGGVIIVTAEIVPEQMFERQKDHFLHITDPDNLPAYTRDYLDPEKVRIVTNDEVDVEHSAPTGTFGYAPLNSQWKRRLPNIGGKFFRALGDPFSEDRQRIWEVEQADPSLTSDFYLATNIHHNVFSDTASDAFEILTVGGAEIVGDTVFGKTLDEDTGDYNAILADVDQTKIDQTA